MEKKGGCTEVCEGGSVGRLSTMMSDRNTEMARKKKKFKSHQGRREGFEKPSKTQNTNLDSSSALTPHQHLMIKSIGDKLFARNTLK